jgi:hypothetical protein
MPAPLRFNDLPEIETVVQKFEQCEYSPKEFTHAHHLSVAAYYLQTVSPTQALTRMRSALQRFTAHHQVKGYHETITRFWLALVAYALENCPDTKLTDRVTMVIACYPDKNAIFDYYTDKTLQSVEARQDWVPPDLKALPQLKSMLFNE